MKVVRVYPAKNLILAALLGVRLLMSSPVLAQKIYFQGDAEPGDTSQWRDTGGGRVNAKGNATLTATQEITHSGNWAFKHDLPDPSISNSAKLARWWIDGRRGISQGYYSAWFYIAEGFVDSTWKNIMQWKARGGNHDPLFLIWPRMSRGTRELVLFHWPCAVKSVWCVRFPQYAGSKGVFRQQNPIPVPDKQWFHLEAFYKASAANGQVIVWQDGTEIFNLSHPMLNTLHSVDASTTEVYWGIGNYVSRESPGRHLLYTKRAMITDYRVGAIDRFDRNP